MFVSSAVVLATATAGRDAGLTPLEVARVAAELLEAGVKVSLSTDHTTNYNCDPFVGMRIKPLNEELRVRSMRTLEIVLTELVKRAGKLPDNFVVTVPKVVIIDIAPRLRATSWPSSATPSEKRVQR